MNIYPNKGGMLNMLTPKPNKYSLGASISKFTGNTTLDKTKSFNQFNPVPTPDLTTPDLTSAVAEVQKPSVTDNYFSGLTKQNEALKKQGNLNTGLAIGQMVLGTLEAATPGQTREGVTSPSALSILNQGKWTSIGAQLGGGYGAAAGAVADLGEGTYNYITASKAADKQIAGIRQGRVDDKIAEGKNLYGTLRNSYQKKDIFSSKNGGTIFPKYKFGGAVILGGKRHTQGGNDVVNEQGGKVAETESKELLLNIDQSKTIEYHIAEYDKTKDKSHLAMLGNIMKNIITHQTVDNSGAYPELN